MPGYLDAIQRAASNSLGSHLRQAEAAQLAAKLSDLRVIEQRANLVAGLSMHNAELQGQHRAAVFILTGSWPATDQPA